MVLRSTNRKKDGKNHRYFRGVENRRVAGGKTVQRPVLDLGEVHDQQAAAWRKSLEVFDEGEQRSGTLSWFADDREIPADAGDRVQIKLSGLELRRARAAGQLLSWRASGGSNWSWMASGNAGWVKAAKLLVGRKGCGCWS